MFPAPVPALKLPSQLFENGASKEVTEGKQNHNEGGVALSNNHLC